MGLTKTGKSGGLRLAYGAIAALAAAFSFKRLFDADGFWMLAAGRVILDQGLPRVNTLSHTYPEYPWRFTQWLSAASLALAERAGGVPGVQVLLMLCAAALFLTITLTARRNREDFRWPFFTPFLLAAMSGMQYRITPRGDLATLLGLAAVPLLWSLRPRRMYLYAAALAALWSNLHAGVAFGLVEWGVFAATCLLRKDREGLKEAALALGAFFLGSLANPFGIYPYEYIAANATALGDYPLPIGEIAPPSLPGYPFFWGGAVLALPAFLRAIGRRDYAYPLLFLFFGLMAARAIRFIPYFLVVTLPGTANHMAALAGDLRQRGFPPVARLAACGLGLAILGGGVIVETRNGLRGRLAGWGVAAEIFPEGACGYIERRDLPGRIFNEFDHGGYIAWRLYPARRVFIDGRTMTYPWAFFLESLAYDLGKTRRLVDRYGADVAIVERRPQGGNVDLGPVFDEMGWGLAYIEGTSYVFVRPDSEAWRAARADLYRIVKPWQNWDQILRAAWLDPGRATEELGRVPAERLIMVDEYRVLAAAAFHAGSLALCESFLAAGLARHPRNVDLLQEHATVSRELGRTAEARADLERVLTIDPAGEEGAAAREALRGLPQDR